MKKIVFWLGVLLLLTVVSCKEDVMHDVNIDMQKITGEWINKTYVVPDDAEFFIYTHRGSYALRYYRTDANWLRKSSSGTLVKNGIIDYNIIKVY